jgi:hypothetical protein
MISGNQKKTVRVWPWVFAALIIIISAALYFLFIYQKPTSPSNKPEAAKAVPKVSDISSNLLFTGNVYWGRYINDWSMASDLKYAYPFSRLNEFHRENYNAWISGLECPLVKGVNMTSAEEDSTLTFNCNPDYLPEAAKFFSIFTLANNHTDNQGVAGFEETKTHLEAAGIQYFGNYDYKNVNDACEVVGMPVTVQKDDASKTSGFLPVALCGYMGVFGIPVQEAIDQISKYSSYMPTIAMPHMGAEYKTSADELKQNVYRSMIDAGADAVIGDHPHFIQNSEGYNGRLIVYSMGNFIFDQQDSVEVSRSAAVSLQMTIKETDSATLGKWLEIGNNCKAFKDDCLDKIKDAGLTKLKIDYKFGIVGSNDSGKINKPATVEQQNSILNRLNWSTTIKQLQPPYSGV